MTRIFTTDPEKTEETADIGWGNFAAYQDRFAVVGELVVMAAVLDLQLNRVVIGVLHLEPSVIQLPVIATLDAARKIEILKACAKHANMLRTKLLKYCDQVERILKQRNIACHAQLVWTNPPSEEAWAFKQLSAAKALKELNRTTSLDDFRAAIGEGNSTFILGYEIEGICNKLDPRLKTLLGGNSGP
jgi:hypothetical protein